MGNGIGIIPKVINIVSKINILSDRSIPKKKSQNGGHNMAPKVNFFFVIFQPCAENYKT